VIGSIRFWANQQKPDDPLKCCPNQGHDCSNNGTHFNSFIVQTYLDRESCDLWDLLCDGEYFKVDFHEYQTLNFSAVVSSKGQTIFRKSEPLEIIIRILTFILFHLTGLSPLELFRQDKLWKAKWEYFLHISSFNIVASLELLKRYRNDYCFIMWTGGKSNHSTRWNSWYPKGRDPQTIPAGIRRVQNLNGSDKLYLIKGRSME